METLISLLITLFSPFGFDLTSAIRHRKGVKPDNNSNIAKDNNNSNNNK